ncbi:biotin/lipoate A/B protein ligase family protein [Acetonema longum]|uniref:Biotin/lipoate A/B protein ligase n=1 Tax=Acetonema longum DSM 6540 TaxID=1009370 RepID=F7NPI1_9FIRM|nr:biotin/lipoate A/B protein ligase family protein [Acetonema longum]EGO62061.1 biotin/lipoate A/B protein ligase [Acetonema longum DSM 6540]
MMQWRVLNTGIENAAVNMAIDEAILLEYAAGHVPPTLRFYGWQPAAVSLGYFQRGTEEIDLAACREQGISVVRRLTGGRAVLHDAELTYSLVVGEHEAGIPATITASYCYFSQGLIAGLARLGVAAQMNMPRSSYGQGERRPPHTSAACFDAPAHYEITAAGRKLVGSAQVRKQGVILQHGSLLLRFEPRTLASILQAPTPEKREALAGMLAARAIGLEELLNRKIGFPEIFASMLQGFDEVLDGGLVQGRLTAAEQGTAKDLAATKYSQDSWNFRR